jgi:hypothetical protein
MRARLLLGVTLLVALGCGRKFVPVSGKVTLDGKALAGATVSFQPIASEGSSEAGIGSQGKTNDKGEFTLTTSTGKTGAVPGKHRVRITSLSQQVGEGDSRPPRGGWPLKDRVPERFNEKTTLTIEVPAGGTDKADFDLKSP